MVGRPSIAEASRRVSSVGPIADLQGDVVAVAVVVDEGEVPVLAHVLVDVHDGRDDVRVARVDVLPEPRAVVILHRGWVDMGDAWLVGQSGRGVPSQARSTHTRVVSS